MYIFVNSDLNMSPGKIAAQVGHMVEKITDQYAMMVYEQHDCQNAYLDYMRYKKTGRRKIILSATQDEMEDLMKEEGAIYYVDEGLTEVPENSLTVVGFLPSDENKEKFQKYKLL